MAGATARPGAGLRAFVWLSVVEDTKPARLGRGGKMKRTAESLAMIADCTQDPTADLLHATLHRREGTSSLLPPTSTLSCHLDDC